MCAWVGEHVLSSSLCVSTQSVNYSISVSLSPYPHPQTLKTSLANSLPTFILHIFGKFCCLRHNTWLYRVRCLWSTTYDSSYSMVRKNRKSPLNRKSISRNSSLRLIYVFGLGRRRNNQDQKEAHLIVARHCTGKWATFRQKEWSEKKVNLSALFCPYALLYAPVTFFLSSSFFQGGSIRQMLWMIVVNDKELDVEQYMLSSAYIILFM